MAVQASLGKNFIMNILLAASSLIFPLITYPYVSRILLPDGTGRVAFAVSVVSYFTMTASLGIPTYGIRACAGVRDDKKELSQTVQEIFLINAAMTLLVCLVFAFCLAFVPKFQDDRALFLVCGISLLFNLVGMEWLYKALEQYQYITFRSIAFKALSVALMFVMIRSREDYLQYGFLTIFAGVGSNIFNFFHARRYITFVPQRPYRLKRHLRPILILFALTVTTTIYTNLDTVMLGFLKDSETVGYYNAAVKIKELLATIVAGLGSVLLPRISYYIKNGQFEKFRELIRRSFAFVTVFAIPLCVYLIIMSDYSIDLFYGPTYENSVLPMRLILPTLIYIGLTNTIGIQILVPTDREKLVVYSTCAGAVTDLILNAVLIPVLGASGAALGTLAAEIVVLLVQLWFIRGEIRSFCTLIQLKKILSALVPATVILLFMHTALHLHTFFMLCVTAAVFFPVYLGVLLLLRYKIKLRG